MCGIVGFLSSGPAARFPDLSIYSSVMQTLAGAEERGDLSRIEHAVVSLASRFDEMMSFELFNGIVSDNSARQVFVDLASQLSRAQQAIGKRIAAEGASESLLHVNEMLRDYLWQIEVEILGLENKVVALLPDSSNRTSAPRLFIAWAIERVLSSLDKLEVRGRDSAGISVVLPTTSSWQPSPAIASELERRAALDETESGLARLSTSSGTPVVQVVHKVANLVGRLGDNGAHLRASVKADMVLWSAADASIGANIVAHTRWASTGAITIANCHPVSGAVVGKETGRDVIAIVNGDIDNYAQLMSESVRGRGLRCHQAVTTDSKVLPVLLALETNAEALPGDRLLSVLKGCQGSLAAACQFIDRPNYLAVGQQGSGQALYVGETVDGWLLASEVYGLAAMCRRSKALSTGGGTGVVVTLSVAGADRAFAGNRITGEPWDTPEEPISIFSRDIFRGDYDYFIEKEIAEAPESVRKTIAGKYVSTGDEVQFRSEAFGNGAMLARRLRSTDKTAIRRIVVIGHGTASIAGFGIAHLMKRALAKSSISIEWAKASELFGFASHTRLDDTILVAVSQSGTTTDTNRIVDIARQRGAWIHAIVNRRNSALIQKSDSYLYTSDGRDVEMSVASTKAYYSQVAAGKILSLFIAAELEILSGRELAAELAELESLAAKIREVWNLRPKLDDLARTYALHTKNWAVVGNGPNRVAAEEIRIKASELCYKAIPCDVTEDKKHIDLSSEPMTIVIANDLPEEVVQDTVKEVAIFKAHNGHPLVFCAENESRFDAVAEAVIPLPHIGGGLGFVLATATGHLFSVAAAKAMDAAAHPVRVARAEFTRAKENPALWNGARAIATLAEVSAALTAGVADAILAPSMALKFSEQMAAIQRNPDPVDPAAFDAMLTVLTALVDELGRPIDTIRHQAKTVTVGVSRPQRELSPLIEESLYRLGFSPTSLADRDRDVLEIISPLVRGVRGAIRYSSRSVSESAWVLTAEAAVGAARIQDSRYVSGKTAEGSKRKALRTGSLQFSTGRNQDQSVVVVPMWRNGVPSDLLLIDLELLRHVPARQMLNILRGLDNAYDEFVDVIGEYQPGASVVEVIGRYTPRSLVFRGARWCLQNPVEISAVQETVDDASEGVLKPV